MFCSWTFHGTYIYTSAIENPMDPGNSCRGRSGSVCRVQVRYPLDYQINARVWKNYQHNALARFRPAQYDMQHVTGYVFVHTCTYFHPSSCPERVVIPSDGDSTSTYSIVALAALSRSARVTLLVRCGYREQKQIQRMTID